MKEKSTSQSARVLIALLVCGAACSIVTGTLLAFFRTETPARVSHPAVAGLTFAERVSYQRAIEEVYWRHRIWPKENAYPKPSLDAVMSQAQLETKVVDYLRNSQALADYSHRPLTAEQLQGETNRMAEHTKQPQVLRELFAALGNDPYIIAECLARPLLAERLLTPSASEQVKKTSRIFEQVVAATGDYSLPSVSEVGGCTDDTWTATNITNVPTGRFGHTTVWTGTEMIVWGGGYDNTVLNTGGRYDPATDSWTATATTGAPLPLTGHTAVWTGTEMIVWAGIGGRYNPATNSWTPTSTTNAPSSRVSHTAVWTGSEMIVWGGFDGFSSVLNTGGKYNPSTNSWSPTSTTNAPTARTNHTAVWTGTEMIIWGGWDAASVPGAPPIFFNSGRRYNPNTDSWTVTSISNAPTGRADHTAVWTGIEMIVWGGNRNSLLLNTGGRYNPGTNSWTATSITNAPSGRIGHTAVWTLSEMIVWGGSTASGVTDTGGRYDPATGSWTAISTVNAPVGRESHTAVWIGNQMIVWGGWDGGSTYFGFNTGARYCAPGPASQLGNISTRAFVQTGDNIMIGGFIVQGI